MKKMFAGSLLFAISVFGALGQTISNSRGFETKAVVGVTKSISYANGTPEELLACPANSVKSASFVKDGFVGFKSSDQGRPGLPSKFFQSFSDNYWKVNGVKCFAMFNYWDREKRDWLDCDSRGKINDKYEMTEPIRLEVSFYKMGEDLFPAEEVYKEIIDVKGKFTGVEMKDVGRIYSFEIPLKKEIVLETGFLSVSAVDMGDKPTCWFSVLTCESVPGIGAMMVDGEMEFASNRMTYCLLGTGDYAAKKAIKLCELRLPGEYGSGKYEKVSVELKNVGSDPISDVKLELLLDGESQSIETVPGIIRPFETRRFIFKKRINLTKSGYRKLEIKNLTDGDEGLCEGSIRKAVRSRYPDEACSSMSQTTKYGHIKSVKIGEIHNETKASLYGRYLNLSTPIKVGEVLDLEVLTEGKLGIPGVWIDWNMDGDFDGDKEFIGFVKDNHLSISIPQGIDVTPSYKRLRIVYSSENVGPCSIYEMGETEDYLLEIIPPEDGAIISLKNSVLEATSGKDDNEQSKLPLVIKNIGKEVLEGRIDVDYYLPYSPCKIKRLVRENSAGQIQSRIMSCPVNSSLRSEPENNDAATYILKYDDGNFTAITPQGTASAVFAQRYAGEMISELAGMKISSLDIYFMDVPNSAEARIYSSKDGAKASVVASKAFTAKPNSWNRVTFDQPIEIGSEDLLIAVQMQGFARQTFCMGVDHGPAVVGYGDLMDVGDGNWWSMGDYGLKGNFCIRANVIGDRVPAISWLTVPKEHFSIPAKGEESISMSLSKNGLQSNVYEAQIRLTTNDKLSSLKKVKVYFVVEQSSVGLSDVNTLNSKISYRSTDRSLSVVSQRSIKLLQLYDMSGRLLLDENNPGTETTMSLQECRADYCILKIDYNGADSEIVKFKL